MFENYVAVGWAMSNMAIIVDAKRFKDRNHFLSYCGLLKLDRMSGGKNYGKKILVIVAQ